MKLGKRTVKITARERLSVSLRMLKTSWKIRKSAVIGYFSGSTIEISGFILGIYATAKLGALLANFVVTGETTSIWFWLWTDVFAAMLIAVGYFFMEYFKRLLYFAFTGWSVDTFLEALCTIDFPNYYDEYWRNQINKVSGSYTWRLSNLASANLELIYAVARFLAITVIVSQITWWLVPLIALFLVPTLLAESKLAQLQWFVWDSKGDQRHIFWGLDWILRQAKGQMEIRSTQAGNYLRSKVSNLNHEFYSEQEGKYRSASSSVVFTKILEVAGTTVGSVVLLLQFLARSISLDRYFFLSGALLRIGGALNNIFGTLSRMQEDLLFANSYFSLVDLPRKLVDKVDAKVLQKDVVPTIEFKNIAFTYPGQSQPVFENLNLAIRSGENVAIVGENGAGKSTLIKLLLRLYRPTKGQILINGIDLQHISIESWYEHVATLFQDFNMYPFPIDENIYVGRTSEESNPAILEQAANFGGVSKLVKSYKHGWKTVLDSSFEKGVEPSGGQWQRVALSRVFYRNAQVLILDEPTSAIDAKAEFEIFNNIFDHFKEKSAIIVSHRFSTVRRADRIIVLEHGKVTESGTHKQLVKQKGLYKSMFDAQATGYK